MAPPLTSRWFTLLALLLLAWPLRSADYSGQAVSAGVSTTRCGPCPAHTRVA